MKGYIIYSGISGFDNLTSSEIKSLYDEVMPDLLRRLEPHKENSKEFNLNWGFVFAVYEEAKDAIATLLELRDFYKANDSKIREVKEFLCPFVYGTYDDAQMYISSSFNSKNYYLATAKNANFYDFALPKNDVFVSFSFRLAMVERKETVTYIRFSDIGYIDTGSYLGEVELLKMLREGEENVGFEKLKPYDLEYSMPTEEKLSPIELAIINSLINNTDIKRMIQILTSLDIRNRSTDFLIKLSMIYDKLFLYDKALDCMNLCKEKSILFENTSVYPNKNKTEVLTQEALLKTKLGKYDEAYNIIYGLYYFNGDNIEALKLLAFHFKRRALFDSEGRLYNNLSLNRNLLYKAKDIYLEVYRKSKYKDFESALAAAYIFRIIGKTEGEKGKKLGRNIFALGAKETTNSIELKIILAESKLVQDGFPDALSLFRDLIIDDRFTVFHRRLVLENLMLYDKLVSSTLDSYKRIMLFNIIEVFK